MANKVLCLALFFACVVHAAEERFDIRLKEKGGPNVLLESTRLNISGEPTVQRQRKPSTRSYAMGWGQLNAGQVTVKTPNRTVDYDLSGDTHLLRFSYLTLPWEWAGQWGVQTSLGYGFHEITGKTKTMLHMIPTSLEAVYRGRLSRNRVWAPQAGLGVGNVIYIQRGSPEYETSESKWMGVGSVGLWWGVGEWLTPNSPVPAELTLSYTRLVAQKTELNDWSGSMIALSLGVGL